MASWGIEVCAQHPTKLWLFYQYTRRRGHHGSVTAVPNVLVDCIVLALNALVKAVRRELAMQFYGFAIHLLGLFYADPRCFDDMCCGGGG